jgi:hypothetical protein
MKQFLFSSVLVLLVSCSGGEGQKPTKDDVTNAIKSSWEKDASNTAPKTTVTMNDITFGTSENSNYAQQLEGVPKEALITNAKIDFTENIFYTDQTKHTRRIMTAWVYKDSFDEWAIMNTYTAYPDN